MAIFSVLQEKCCTWIAQLSQARPSDEQRKPNGMDEQVRIGGKEEGGQDLLGGA